MDRPEGCGHGVLLIPFGAGHPAVFLVRVSGARCTPLSPRQTLALTQLPSVPSLLSFQSPAPEPQLDPDAEEEELKRKLQDLASHISDKEVSSEEEEREEKTRVKKPEMIFSSDDMASEARKVIHALLPVLFWAPPPVPSSLALCQRASCFIPHLPNQNLGSQFRSTESVSPALRALCYLPSPPAASNRRRDQLVPLILKPRFSGSALNSATFCPKGSREDTSTLISVGSARQYRSRSAQLRSRDPAELQQPKQKQICQGKQKFSFFFASR